MAEEDRRELRSNPLPSEVGLKKGRAPLLQADAQRRVGHNLSNGLDKGGRLIRGCQQKRLTRLGREQRSGVTARPRTRSNLQDAIQISNIRLFCLEGAKSAVPPARILEYGGHGNGHHR